MPSSAPTDRPYRLPGAFISKKVGIVTVTYNSAEVLRDFMRSIDCQHYQNIGIYVVDNASKDSTLEQLRVWKRKNLQIIPNTTNLGVAAGNNQGIRAALEDGCEFVLLLNNDVVFHEDLIQRLVDGIGRFGCQMTTPKTYFFSPSDVLWCAGGCLQPLLLNRTHHYGEGLRDEGQFDIPRNVSYTPTCCVLVHRDVFGRIGIMDERYFVYCDDTDFMLRANRAGIVLYYLPDAQLWHKVSSLSGNSSDFTLFYSTRGRSLLIRKHSGLILAWAWVVFYSWFCGLRCCFGRDDWRKGMIRMRGTREGMTASRFLQHHKLR